MSTATYDNNVNANSTCANCGKKGEESNSELKACTACKLVKYCNVSCQKAHRPQHKKECRKRAAELHDEKLFEQPPQKEDCPICFLRMPYLDTGTRYMVCCGKDICSGCIHAGAVTGDDELCPFCRAIATRSDNDAVKRMRKRMEVNDAQAMYELGCYHQHGQRGLPQDVSKALELYHRAGELGHSESYCNIGYIYSRGQGVEIDEKKARHYYELAAIGGDVVARSNVGNAEFHANKMDRALKHYMIAVEGGSNESLKAIKYLYTTGRAAKDDYAKALRAYQTYLGEIRSDDRDKAAAFSDIFKYYE